jgi:hypothetical protein
LAVELGSQQNGYLQLGASPAHKLCLFM